VPHSITLIPGDGIGPEVADATVRAIEATGVEIEWDRVDAGLMAEQATGQVLPETVFTSLETTRVGLKGPVGTPVGKGHASVNVALRKRLDLFVNFRPVKMLPGLKTRFQDLPIDMVIFRENTEDLYSGIEHEVVPGVVESLKVITRTASLRIAQSAFEYARREERRKMTAVHKANIMKMSDGLFLRCCREVAAQFPEIEYGEMIVDNTCMQLVMRPETFDVLVLPNPTALMQSAVLMLAHLGERDASKRLQKAIQKVYADGKHLTADVGGHAGTDEFTTAIIDKL
jgi:isocitrate dehydrogenase (NAD+)